MRKFTVEIIDDGENISINRSNDGFLTGQLVGYIELIKIRLMQEVLTGALRQNLETFKK